MSITTAATATNNSPKVEPLSCAIGAEVQKVNLGAAARDPGLMAEIRSLLLQYKVLFFRDQDITRAEHVVNGYAHGPVTRVGHASDSGETAARWAIEFENPSPGGAVPDSGLTGRLTSSATQPFRSIPASFSSTAQTAPVSWLPRPCATPA